MSLIQRLRLAGVLEGYSYLFLFVIAMPLKYLAHQPLAVEIGGWVHGMLFIVYNIMLLLATRKYRWSLFQYALGFAAAWIPFGTLYLDHKLKQVEFPVE